MKIKSTRTRIIPAALLALGLGMNHAGTAQVPAPPIDSVASADRQMPTPPPPPPAPGRPGRPDRPGGPLAANGPDRRPGPAMEPDREGLAPVGVFKGTVSRFIANDDLVYDGFTLQNGSDSFHIHFAPSMGEAVMKLLKAGSTVTVNGVAHQAPAGEKEIEAVTLLSGGTTIEIHPPSAPPMPAIPTFVKGSGKVTGMGKDLENRVNCLILSDHEILRFPPGAFTDMTPAPAVGAVISYTGTVRGTGAGEARQVNTKVIVCQTITVNGQQYLVSRR